MKINIEYFHIYTDEKITPEHTASINIAKRIEQSLLKKGNISVSRLVMIDNYNPEIHTLTEQDVTNHLKENNFLPDVIVYEANLYNSATKLLTKVKPRIYKEYTKLIKKQGYIPCSQFIATLNLIKLGEMKDPSFPEHLVADKIILVLPKKFEFVEKKALNIIKNSEFSDRIEDITHYFYGEDKIELNDGRHNTSISDSAQLSSFSSSPLQIQTLS